ALAGRSFLDLVHPDDRGAVRASMQTLIHEDAADTIDFECRLISNEARSLWMEWKHRKADGKIYSVGRDMTAAKKHEQALQRREQQLSEAEAIGHMGHWHWRLGEQELNFSDEIFRIFGVGRGTFQPTLESVNAMLHRRDVGRMMQAFQRAIIEQNDHEIDFRVMAPDGQTRHVRCQGRCEFDAEGEVVGLYGIMQDVTQAILHERALMEAKDVAERAYAAKSQFLANMSHELRTPLNAIIGFSEMIQQQLLGPIGTEKYLDYIKGIRESGEHLLDLITDILDMSKIEAGKYELSLEEINAAKVVRLAIHMVESRASEKSIRITADIPDDAVKIVADRRAVMQIALNLLSNAVKFSHKNSEINVDCVRRGDHLVIRVKDHGIGIPANKLKTIANPFEQAENQYTRRHEGSGLGLSITKELAELHGGSIHIESVVDMGTTVSARLPADASTTRRDRLQ
ncbi:MAG: ATP-binding protein, partial [Micavibrio sp.]